MLVGDHLPRTVRFRPLYALHDQPDQRSKGAFEVAWGDVPWHQEQGYGIFWTPNLFSGARLTRNVTGIRYWFTELDGGTKEEQANRLKQAALMPSMVVESARGYHCYWAATDGTLDNWKRVERGLVRALDGDPKATDAVRLLRVPGTLHLKDPAAPFEVKLVWDRPYKYTEAQMLRAFPGQERKAAPQRDAPGDGFWERVAALHGKDALERLSGHWLVNGEHFELEPQTNGNWNIFRLEADGGRTGTPCFVDSAGRLGGLDYGPSVAAWARWYRDDWGRIAEGLREVFPELEEQCQ